jgi:hypothetical protein
MSQAGGEFREAYLVFRILQTKMRPALFLSCARLPRGEAEGLASSAKRASRFTVRQAHGPEQSRRTRYELRRGSICSEDFTGAGQKQPGSWMETGTWLSGSLDKCVQVARAEAIAVWSQMWHEGCEGTVSEV